jgi:hypothetical protein
MRDSTENEYTTSGGRFSDARLDSTVLDSTAAAWVFLEPEALATA